MRDAFMESVLQCVRGGCPLGRRIQIAYITIQAQEKTSGCQGTCYQNDGVRFSTSWHLRWRAGIVSRAATQWPGRESNSPLSIEHPAAKAFGGERLAGVSS